MVHGVKNSHGNGLGAGKIPPGIQKKLENGKISEKFIEKFPQLGEFLNGKNSPVQTEPAAKNNIKTTTSPYTPPEAPNLRTQSTAPANLPQGIMSLEALTKMANVPLPSLPPPELLNIKMDSLGLPSLSLLA